MYHQHIIAPSRYSAFLNFHNERCIFRLQAKRAYAPDAYNDNEEVGIILNAAWHDIVIVES